MLVIVRSMSTLAAISVLVASLSCSCHASICMVERGHTNILSVPAASTSFGQRNEKHVYFAVSEVCLSGCNMLRQQWERQISFGCGCNLPVCQVSNQPPCPSPGDGVWQKFVIWI